MDRQTVWRTMITLHNLVTNHARITNETPFNYEQLKQTVYTIGSYTSFLNSYEQQFLEWATRSVNEEYYGGYSTPLYGLVNGHAHPECYANVRKRFDTFIGDREVFNYIYDEYILIQNAKNVDNVIRDRECRTCDLCETRFETYQGMHRHRGSCTGKRNATFAEKLASPLFRGDYHPKPVLQTTSQW
jgi:hypothetical protein